MKKVIGLFFAISFILGCVSTHYSNNFKKNSEYTEYRMGIYSISNKFYNKEYLSCMKEVQRMIKKYNSFLKEEGLVYSQFVLEYYASMCAMNLEDKEIVAVFVPIVIKKITMLDSKPLCLFDDNGYGKHLTETNSLEIMCNDKGVQMMLGVYSGVKDQFYKLKDKYCKAHHVAL